MVALIVCRAAQGLGAGGMFPLAQTVVGDLYTGSERPRVQGFLSGTWGIAAVIGPLLGAFLVQHVGWPTVFWLNVPFGILCVAIVVVFLHERIERVAHTIDYLGSLLLAAGVGTVMYVLVMAGNIAGPTAAALTAFGAIVIATLFAHERRTPEPMIPLALYRRPIIAVANSGNFAIGAMTMGITAFLPTYVQGAMGRSAVVAGTVIGVMLIAWTFGSIAGARLMVHTSYRLTAIAGSVPVVIGCALLLMLTPERGIPWAIAGSAFLGLGFGFINSVFIIATQAAVGWEERGSATASNVFLRNIGQAIGTAVFGAVFNLGVYARIPDAGPVVSRMMDPQMRAQLPPAEVLRDANAIALALHPVYLILAVTGVALFMCAVALPAKLRPERGSAPASRPA
jgi:MFS family permease